MFFTANLFKVTISYDLLLCTKKYSTNMIEQFFTLFGLQIKCKCNTTKS